jgi:hypothetical protein
MEENDLLLVRTNNFDIQDSSAGKRALDVIQPEQRVWARDASTKYSCL